MFPIAGQTAGPIGLKFFVDTHEGCYRLKKIRNFFFQNFFFFHGQRRDLQLVIYTLQYCRELVYDNKTMN